MTEQATLGLLGGSIDRNFSLPVSDPVFWELILVLFLLSLRFWGIRGSILFIILLSALVLTVPLWAARLSEHLLAYGVIFDADLMRLLAACIIALLFYLYITKWRQ